MPGKGESSTSARRVSATVRQARALEMRMAGWSYQAIANELGYASRGAAHDAILAALKKTLQPPAEEVRALEVERLDGLLKTLWPQARQGNHGAIDRVLKVMERRARLLGLDAPVKSDVTTDIRRVVIEYVNDWRNTPAIPTSWPDDCPPALAADDGAERGAALAQDDAGNGDHG